ncbi:MAG: TVP38/TMEM64 family protein [Dongiaceae bacterium]
MNNRVTSLAEGTRRFWPLLLLAGAAVIFLAFDFHGYINLEAVRENRALLLGLVDRHWLASFFAFFALYALLVALSLPVASIMTIAGGFLFGITVGGTASIVAETLGACIVFLVAQSAFGNLIKARAGSWMERVEAGFQENALYYMLTLRLIPIFPAFIINLVAPFVGVSFRVYAIATLFGVLPSCIIFASFGAGLGAIFDADKPVALENVLTPTMVFALTGLGLLMLLPVFFKAWKKRRARIR